MKNIEEKILMADEEIKQLQNKRKKLISQQKQEERKKMLTNMDYKHQQKTGEDNKYRWDVSTVSRITRDKEYTGCLIKEVSTRKEVGSKERAAVNPKDWIVVPNHHAPIISEEVFNKVQSLKAKRPKYFKKGEAIDSPIKSLVICKHCGHKIRFLKRTDDIELSCRYGNLHKIECSSMCYKMNDIEKVVLNAIQIHFNLLLDQKRLHALNKKALHEKSRTYNKQIVNLTKEKEKTHKLIRKDYENYKLGNLDKNQLLTNKKLYNQKLEKIEEEILNYEQQLENNQRKMKVLINGLKIREDFYNITSLTKELVDRTIEQIFLGPNKEIEIKYKDYLSRDEI